MNFRNLVCAIFSGGLFILGGFSSVLGEEEDTSTSGELFNLLAEKDRALFEAFNQCDPGPWDQLLSDDIEFYHDVVGLIPGKEDLQHSFNDRCNPENTHVIRRELVEGSLEVFPMNNYGAIQRGVHVFYEGKKGEELKLAGKARFTHLWKNTDGVWQISLVLSFDHSEIE